MGEMDYSLLENLDNTPTTETQDDTTADNITQVAETAEQEGSTEVSDNTSTDEPSVDTSDYTERERALLARIDEMTQQAQRSSSTTRDEETPTSLTEPEVINFLDNVDIDEALASPENFNKLLNKVHNAGMEKSSKLAAETIMKNLPQVISQYVRNHLTMNEIVNNFYSENPDLGEVKSTVAEVANSISNQHPEYSTDKVFAETASRVRTMLKLKPITNGEKKGGVNDPLKGQKRNPGFASQRGRKLAQAPLQGLSKEIEDLLVE